MAMDRVDDQIKGDELQFVAPEPAPGVVKTPLLGGEGLFGLAAGGGE